MLTSTDDTSGWSGSRLPVTLTSPKCPRTVIMPRCLAANSTWVWKGSACQLMMCTPLCLLLVLRCWLRYGDDAQTPDDNKQGQEEQHNVPWHPRRFASRPVEDSSARLDDD